jgi:acyl-coenzyme A thioesterase PaaI-like protein
VRMFTTRNMLIHDGFLVTVCETVSAYWIYDSLVMIWELGSNFVTVSTKGHYRSYLWWLRRTVIDEHLVGIVPVL